MKRLVVAMLVMCLPSVALADREKADMCAVSLQADAKRIYEEVVPSVAASTNIKRIARRQAKLLARAGKIDSANAVASTLQARTCLRLARPGR
ncbi:hypothetical protein [Candidatus Raskinella chloraquaticus]|jgi:hypothetical protein